MAPHEAQSRENAVHVGIVVVERQRHVQLSFYLMEGGVAIGAPAVSIGLAQYAALPGMRVGVVRIERQRHVQLSFYLMEGGVAIGAPAVSIGLAQYAALPGMRVGVVR